MNRINIYWLFIGALMLVFSACDPIEDRDVLKNSFNPDAIELEAIQSTPGGNKLTLKMNTPGVAGYWDYVIDKKFSDRVEVIYPIPGLNTFTFHVTTAYMTDGTPMNVEYVSASIDVQIDVLDNPLPAAYYALVGDDLEGKTWVFDGGPEPEQGGLWWYMVSPDNYQEVWWNAGGECCPPSDAAGRMIFDLDGGANYTYYSGPNADPITGSSFAFNSDFTQLRIVGDANILGSEGNPGDNPVFNIIELSSDRMVLFVPNAAGGTGWVWVFRPA
ncbi:hypothetical protein [Alkalitalea saponilacus]|uniref:Uncharacterized protein n=1 Tax=Alkalitalea saponilacus TaxID=889453 RepID=A0A1T5A272_9BACT|nr:hypothetical protein [Alkalitalea saponilacus]ASB48904.1 hypothetical protein CDL62_07025 [Alkalitalea saponilacus]SKB28955.1 hypothetical protein SAMN03080601_00032 [Alkalitalea saponilacus]